MADMWKWFKRSVYGVARVYTNEDLAEVTPKEKGVMKNDPIKYKFKSLLDCVLIGEKTIAFRDVSIVKRNFSEPIRYEDIKAVRLLEENWSHPYNTIEIDVPNREEPWKLHFNQGDYELALEVYNFIEDKRGEKRRVEEGHRDREELRNKRVLEQNEQIIDLLQQIANGRQNHRPPQNDIILALLEKKLDRLLDQLVEIQKENDQLKQELKELKEQKAQEPENSKESAKQGIEQGLESFKKNLANQKQKVKNFEEGITEYKQELQGLEQTEVGQDIAPQMKNVQAIEQNLQQFKQTIEKLEQEVEKDLNDSSEEPEVHGSNTSKENEPEQKKHEKKGVDRKFRDAETALKLLQVGFKNLKSREVDIRRLTLGEQNKLLEGKWEALENFRKTELSYVQEAELKAIEERREFDTDRLNKLVEEYEQCYRDLSKFETDLQKKPEQEQNVGWEEGKAEITSSSSPSPVTSEEVQKPPRMSKKDLFEAIKAEKAAEKAAGSSEVENSAGGTGKGSKQQEQTDRNK